MILEEGNKVLIVHRRLFENDETRFFIGVVDGYEGGIAKVSGWSWVRNPFGGNLVERSDIKTKIFALSSGTLIVYQLPDATDPKALRFEMKGNGELWLTDGQRVNMNLTEREYHLNPKPRER